MSTIPPANTTPSAPPPTLPVPPLGAAAPAKLPSGVQASAEALSHAQHTPFGGARAGWEAVRSFWIHRWWMIALALAVCCCWDRAVYLRISVGASLGDAVAQEARKTALESGALFSLLKSCGEPWAAMLIAAALVLIDWAHFASRGSLTAPRVARRATMIALTPLLSAGLAELLKGLSRRQRPIIALDESGLGGWYHFRWWWDGPFRWEGLGFASSHAAAAFGLAFALCAIWPRWAGIWLITAVFVGFSRMLTGAHFLSDVFGGLMAGYTVFLFMYEWDRWNNRGVGVERHLSAAETSHLQGVSASRGTVPGIGQ